MTTLRHGDRGQAVLQLQKQLNAILEPLQTGRAFYGPIFPTDPQDGQLFTLMPDQHIYQWQADHWEQLTS